MGCLWDWPSFSYVACSSTDFCISMLLDLVFSCPELEMIIECFLGFFTEGTFSAMLANRLCFCWVGRFDVASRGGKVKFFHVKGDRIVLCVSSYVVFCSEKSYMRIKLFSVISVIDILNDGHKIINDNRPDNLRLRLWFQCYWERLWLLAIRIYLPACPRHWIRDVWIHSRWAVSIDLSSLFWEVVRSNPCWRRYCFVHCSNYARTPINCPSSCARFPLSVQKWPQEYPE